MVRMVTCFTIVLLVSALPCAASDIFIRDEVPDLIETLGSSRAITIAYCYRSQSREGVWAGFSTRGAIHGHCPPHFSVQGGRTYFGQPFQSGERYLLALSAPASITQMSPPHAAVDTLYDVASLPGIALDPVDTNRLDDARRLADDLWKLGRGTNAQRKEVIGRWLESKDPSEYVYGLRALQRHDELWIQGFETILVRRLRRGTLPGAWAGDVLARHPSPAVRDLIQDLSRRGPEERSVAVRLAALDSVESTRRWLSTMWEDADPAVRQEWLRTLRPPLSKATRSSLEKLADSLHPEEIGPALEAVSHSGEDSVQIAARIVSHWIRSAPPVRSPSWPVLSDPQSLGWSDEFVLKNLSSSDYWEVERAIRETGRRRLVTGLRTLRERLRTNRGPRGEEIALHQAVTMINALGEARDRDAVPQLVEYAHISDAMVSGAVYGALARIGDRRALPVLRTALRDSCEGPGAHGSPAALVRAMAMLGDQDDVADLARWARNCRRVRFGAMAAIGAIAGTEQAIGVMIQIFQSELPGRELAFYAPLGRHIQTWAAERADSR